MKTSRIKEKLEELLGGSAEEKSTKKKLKTVTCLLKYLDEKEHKLQQKVLTTKNITDSQKLERKLKLIKLQIEKALAYKMALKAKK